MTKDNVNSPSHYTQAGIECIDAIEASMTKEEFKGYLKGNIQKYVWRYELKNGLEDVKKAQWYLNRLVSELDKLKCPHPSSQICSETGKCTYCGEQVDDPRN